MKKTLKAVIEYLGTGFHGWQKQVDLRTAQEEFEKAVSLIVGHPVIAHGAGRTDAGVHALNQVVSFKTTADLPLNRLMYGINAVLPYDMVIKSLAEAPPSFHARWSAIARSYEYHIINRPYRSPSQHRRALYYRVPLDIDSMSKALGYFVGDHDFSAFCAKSSPKSHYSRCIQEATLTENDGHIVIYIKANSFLHNMVRIIVGTLIETGLGKIDPEEVPEILSGGDRNMAGFTAPAFGLYLVEIEYP